MYSHVDNSVSSGVCLTQISSKLICYCQLVNISTYRCQLVVLPRVSFHYVDNPECDWKNLEIMVEQARLTWT